VVAPAGEISLVDQQTLSEMIGAIRSRVSHFMNKFRNLGYIRYNDGDIEVHNGLLINDKPHIRRDEGIDPE
jgi:CRP/FNR family cyclic AMP-dependent transcriptional regulator